jgi:glutaminase
MLRVGGGIVAVVPGKGAIAVFAPPLDEAGNSLKAQKVIQFWPTVSTSICSRLVQLV